MVMSGHSDAISDYEQSGDAIVAIHGPLGLDAAIGTTGARISHGCVDCMISTWRNCEAFPLVRLYRY